MVGVGVVVEVEMNAVGAADDDDDDDDDDDVGIAIAMEAAWYDAPRGVKGRARGCSKCVDSFNPFGTIPLVAVVRATTWYRHIPDNALPHCNNHPCRHLTIIIRKKTQGKVW